jgi:2-desacetyl-2-hydroxyethyl bacteriochlorophyllide A dehydrogenase
MRAMVLHEYGRVLTMEDVSDPSCGSAEIVMKVEGCGICFTDVKIVTGQLSAFIELPHIPGHEIAGTVVEVGKDVRGITIGQKGVCYFLIGCGDCDRCRNANENLCYSLTRIGFEFPGGYAQYVRFPAYSFCRFDEDIPFERMAILPDAVATPYHALTRLARLAPGETVLIVGIGGLGVHAVQIVRLMGGTVIAADVKGEALEMAREYGAAMVINTGERNPLEYVKEQTHGRGVDVVLEGVGSPETIAWTLPSLRKGGRLIIMGYDPVTPVPINVMDMHNNEWSVQGTKVSNKQELTEVIRLVEQGKIVPVVSRVVTLEEANEGLLGVRERRIAGRTAMKVS